MVADLKPIPQAVTDNVLDLKFWQDYAPKFNITDTPESKSFEIAPNDMSTHNAKIIKEGYVHLHQPGLETPLKNITTLFEHMVDQGLPTVFSFVYDEMWSIAAQLQNFMSGLFNAHEYAMLPDFWAWHVSPGQSGWAPHRDKGAYSLFPDRSPKSMTVWIPLTQVHPLNGCMYIIPAHKDKGYALSDANGANLPPRATLPDMRALPGEAADVFAWTQHAFHWGSSSADDHDMGPRMSVAFEYQRLDVKAYNSPLLQPGIMPSFEQRLALIAKQVQQYTHMYKFGDDLIALAKKIENAYTLPDSVKAAA